MFKIQILLVLCSVSLLMIWLSLLFRDILTLMNQSVVFFLWKKKEEIELAVLKVSNIMTNIQLLEYRYVLGSSYIAH